MTITPETRKHILDRDRRCKKCGKGPPDVALHVDHIVPKSRGGSDDTDNLRALCAPCNLAKHAKPPFDHELAQPPARIGELTGLYCHLTASDEDKDGYTGWMWKYQARVYAIIEDKALLQFFSAWDGYATQIKPIPLAELLCGDWIFYDDEEQWRETGSQAQHLCWSYDERQRRRNAGRE